MFSKTAAFFKAIFFKNSFVFLMAIIVSIIDLNFPFNIKWYLGILMFLPIPSIALFISNKKWKRFLFLIIGYPILIMVIVLFSITNEFATTQINVADKNYYTSEFEQVTNIKLNNEIEIVFKKDTIKYIGNEGEFDAFCFFKTTQIGFNQIKSQIIKDTLFKKETTSSSIAKEVFDIPQISARQFGDKFIKHIEGSRETIIQFSKKNNYIYFSTSHY